MIGGFKMKFRSLFVLLALAALVSGCQSTSIRSAWFDTDFAGPPFRTVLIVGDIGSVADGRSSRTRSQRSCGPGRQRHRRTHGSARRPRVAGSDVCRRRHQQRRPGSAARQAARRGSAYAGVHDDGARRHGLGTRAVGQLHRTWIPVQQVTQYELATWKPSSSTCRRDNSYGRARRPRSIPGRSRRRRPIRRSHHRPACRSQIIVTR